MRRDVVEEAGAESLTTSRVSINIAPEKYVNEFGAIGRHQWRSAATPIVGRLRTYEDREPFNVRPLEGEG